jgi:hypothetical protein
MVTVFFVAPHTVLSNQRNNILLKKDDCISGDGRDT